MLVARPPNDMASAALDLTLEKFQMTEYLPEEDRLQDKGVGLGN